MVPLAPPSNLSDFENKIQMFSGTQVLYFALTILGTIGVILAGVGITSYGAQHGFWSVDPFNLNQFYTSLLIGGGGGGGFLLILAGAVGTVKNYIDRLNSRLASLNQRYNSERTRREEGEVRSVALVKECKRVKRKNQTLNREKELETQRADSAERRAQLLSTEKQGLKRALVSIRSQVEEAERKIDSLSNWNQQLEEKLADVQSQVKEAEELISRLSTDKQQLEGTLSSAQQQIKEAKTRIITLFATVQRLKRKQLSTCLTRKPEEWVKKTWKSYTFDEVAEEKYWAVLIQYRKQLTERGIDLLEFKTIIDRRLRGQGTHNKMYQSLQAIFLYLLEPQKQGGARATYQKLVLKLREAINSDEYKKATASDRAFCNFIDMLCEIRWTSTHLYDYLKDIVHLSIDDEKPPILNAKNFPDAVKHFNEKIEASPHKKPKSALVAQKASGAAGVADFCGRQNPPHKQVIVIFSDESGSQRTITSVRNASPTSLESVAKGKESSYLEWTWSVVSSSEVVTDDYKHYLKVLKKKKKSELFCVYQRKTPGYIEDESRRTAQIALLQKEHDNCFVVIQPVEGELFNRSGKYSEMTTFEELKASLEEEFFDTQISASIPMYYEREDQKEDYRRVFRQLMDDVHEIFFPSEAEVLESTLSNSITDLDRVLKKEYQALASLIKERCKTIDLNQLKKVEHPTSEEKVIEEILKDKEFKTNFLNRIRSQIKNLEQLKKWIPDLTSNSKLETLLQNDKISEALLHVILGTLIHHYLEKNKKIQKLEQRKTLSLKKWQSFIFLVYAFQRMDLKTRLQGVNGYDLDYFKGACKDNQDRGGVQAFVDGMLTLYMLGEENNQERLEEIFYNLLGPPILVKKQGVIPRRLEPGLNVLHLLSKMKGGAREKLKEYRFGPEKWKVESCHVPKVKGQIGMPLVAHVLFQRINEALKLQSGEETTIQQIVDTINNKGLELPRRDELDIFGIERDYIQKGVFNEQRIKGAVNREVVLSQKGTKYRALAEGKSHAVRDYGELKKILMGHSIIPDEKQALQVLASFHQGIGGAIHTHFNEEILGKSQTFFRLNGIPVEGSVTRSFELDLTQKDKITYHFSEPYYLYKRDGEKPLLAFETHARVVYRKGKGDRLQTQGYLLWNVH